jgi:glycosyltransferase involved in cell wall biosynthesis
MTKVLVVATSRKTRGGITSVVKAHETGSQWKKYNCRWIQTHRDGPSWRKILYFLTAYIQFFLMVPFCDIVHIHMASIQSLKRAEYFLWLAKCWNKKTIGHFHPHKPEVIFDESHKDEYRRFFTSVDKIIVLSQQWELWINEALGVFDNIQVLYNPCPLVERRKIEPEFKYILFAAILYKRKGFTDLIEAFSLIAKKYPEWKVILAGTPKRAEDKMLMKELPKRLGVDSQILFPGWIQGEEKDKLFKNASIFCLASKSEGFPMAVLDAWAYGIPVVCTTAGGLVDVVEDGKNSMVFEYGNVEMLSQKLSILMNDADLRAKLSVESQRLADTVFNIKNITNQLDKIYEEVLNE